MLLSVSGSLILVYRFVISDVQPVIERVCQVNDGPCVTYVGPGGAGNFVKMVHNGIEYGDMQLISEAYDVLRTVGGLSNEEMVEAFNEWNVVSNPSAHVSIHFSSGSHVAV